MSNDPNSQLNSLKAARVEALREFIRLDAAIRAQNESFPPQGEWQTHKYNCKCGEEFISFADRTLHVLEFDNYVLHHPAENPPRRVQCPECKSVFIHSIPANHTDVCKPPPLKIAIGHGQVLDFSTVE